MQQIVVAGGFVSSIAVASISGAASGCQNEIGVASAMGAAGAAYMMGAAGTMTRSRSLQASEAGQ